MVKARLGTRAAIAAKFSERSSSVLATIDTLLDAAERGDLAAAKLLIPYLNQGLGMPTQPLAQSSPESPVEELSLDQLRALAAGQGD